MTRENIALHLRGYLPTMYRDVAFAVFLSCLLEDSKQILCLREIESLALNQSEFILFVFELLLACKTLAFS